MRKTCRNAKQAEQARWKQRPSQVLPLVEKCRIGPMLTGHKKCCQSKKKSKEEIATGPRRQRLQGSVMDEVSTRAFERLLGVCSLPGHRVAERSCFLPHR